MKMPFILLCLFSLSASLEMTVVDLGQKISFDSSNKEFIIAYRGPNKNLFLFLITHDKEKLGYHIKCPYSESSASDMQYKEYGFIFSNYAGECDFTLNIDEGDKGSFIVYDLKALYEIKLKNKYGNTKIFLENSYLDDEEVDSAKKLTFLVPNFRTNSNIKFEYVEKVTRFEKFQNPFQVCHENVCKENVTSYYFEKGKSYQIYVKLLRVLQDSSSRYDYAVPPFRFYAEDSVEEYSNDDIKYTYDGVKPSPSPSSSTYRQISIIFILLLTSFMF